eukprot:SAG31_NODE_1240_length_9167_cov_4.729599_4_plen_91_part_00
MRDTCTEASSGCSFSSCRSSGRVIGIAGAHFVRGTDTWLLLVGLRAAAACGRARCWPLHAAAIRSIINSRFTQLISIFMVLISMSNLTRR